MRGGAKFLGFTAMLAVAACDARPGKLTIRSTGTPLSTEVKPVSSRVAEGRSQFVLGNVALALESFRRAVREEPGNIDAITGVAACYDRMGRHDLSRKHYEAALAVDPANESTLAAFATSLEVQGQVEEAGAVRGEIRQRLAARTGSPSASREQLASTSLPVPVPEPGGATPLVDDDRDGRTSLAATANVTAPARVLPNRQTTAPVRGNRTEPVTSVPTSVASVLPTAPARSVTILLPPPRPVAAPSSEQAVAAAPIRIPAPIAAVPSKFATGPRLERTSMAEVALITERAEPMPRTQKVQLAQQASTIRFVPLPQAQTRVAVRVLNAARIDRLAANTRSLMVQHGWKNIVIGNAAAVRARSIILYPASVRLAARRLAAQLGFLSAPRAGKGEVTVLLGSDAAAAVKRRAAT